jgi:hypothetical protein
MKYIRYINCDNKWIHGAFNAKENSVVFSATDYEKLIAASWENQLVKTVKDVFSNYVLERLRPRIFNCMKKCFLSADTLSPAHACAKLDSGNKNTDSTEQ